MTIVNKNIIDRQIVKPKFQVSVSTNALLFIIGWMLLIVQYGTWQGQFATDYSAAESRNATFLLLFSLFAAGIVFIRRKMMRLFLPYKALLIIFFFNLFFASIARGDFYSSIRQFVGVILSFAIALFLSSLLQSVPLNKAIFTLVLCIFVTILVSTYIHLMTSGVLVPFAHDYASRLGGLFFTAYFAMLAGLSGLLSFLGMQKRTNSGQHRVFYVINLLLMSVLMVFTDTRSVMVAYVVCGFLIYFIGFRKLFVVNKIISWFFILGATLFLYYYFFVLPPDTDQSLSNLGLRYSIWEVSFQGILANPLFGYGRQNFLIGSYDAWSINPSLSDTHNAFLSHAIQYGIPSLLIFLLYYGLLILRVINKKDFTYKSFILLPVYWLMVSFFWGLTFTISGGVIQIVVLVTLFGILCHPDIKKAG